MNKNVVKILSAIAVLLILIVLFEVQRPKTQNIVVKQQVSFRTQDAVLMKAVIESDFSWHFSGYLSGGTIDKIEEMQRLIITNCAYLAGTHADAKTLFGHPERLKEAVTAEIKQVINDSIRNPRIDVRRVEVLQLKMYRGE